MKVSAQEEYGLRCLLHMAKSGEGQSISIPEISRAENLSVPNVAKLMRLLRLAGFVQSARGQAGGYTLARPANQIMISEVLEALGGRLYSPSFCERHAGTDSRCMHAQDCSVRALWNSLQASLDGVLRQTSLQDLVRSEAEMSDWISARFQESFRFSTAARAGEGGSR